jgi:hypothetical protein
VYLAILINGLFVLVLLGAIFAVFRLGSRVEHWAFGIGVAVATSLAIAWRIEATSNVHLNNSAYMALGRVTFYLWPSSFMMMDMDPVEPINLAMLVFYSLVILLNGVYYAILGMIFRKLRSLSGGI